jgi:hypothetical protein
MRLGSEEKKKGRGALEHLKTQDYTIFLFSQI